MLFKKQYLELDIIRAVAITLVMMNHFYENAFINLPSESYITQFLKWGWHGVDLFFALSGFLIGGQIIEENLNGTFSFKRFYIKRFWRIFPPYYFSILVAIISTSIIILLLGFNPTSQDISLKSVIINIVYLQNYFPQTLQSGIYWTLAVEEQFYILIPLVIYLFIVYLRKYLLASLLVLIFFGVFIRFILYDPLKEFSSSFLIPFHTRFDNLLFGVFAAYLFISYKDRFENILHFPRNWKFLIFLVSLVSLGASFLYGSYGISYFNICWQFTLTSIGFSATILYVILFPFSRTSPHAFQKIVRLIAKYSYTMYLYHILIMYLLIGFLRYIRIDRGGFLVYFAVFVVYFITTFLISSLIYWLIDSPCMNYRKKITEGIA